MPVRCGWKAVHVPSCRCVFWQVTCLARVQLQSCTRSRPSPLLATSQRRGRISCYSPLSHLPPVTTCIQPSPVMVPFQYQAFLLQVKVRNQSSQHLPRTLKWTYCHMWDKSLVRNLFRWVGGAADQEPAARYPHDSLGCKGSGWDRSGLGTHLGQESHLDSLFQNKAQLN